MKLEIDLLALDTEIGIRAGRRAAVLLLATLPEDEARLAMQQWAVWREAEEEAVDVFRQEGTVDQQPESVGRANAGKTPEQVQVIETHSQMVKVEPEPTTYPQRVQAEPKPRKASYEKFSYGGESFSVKKTGPSAALKRAFADILGADRYELESLHTRLSGLKGIFIEIGREDLAKQVDEALGKRMAELPEAQAEQAEQAEPQAEPQAQQKPVPPAPQPTPPPPAPPPTPPPAQQAQPGMVEWDGKQVRPVVARAMVMKRIAGCSEIEQLDLLTDPADKLADLLTDLGQAVFANEIREALTKKTDELVAKEDAPAAEQRAGPPTPRTAAASNGAGEEPPTLRQLMRKIEHELGMRKVKELMAATVGKKTELGQLTEVEAAALQAAATAALVG
jgi:hypothetical protein